MKSIGISQIAIAIPEYFISLEELAQKRGMDPKKATLGLKVKEARIPYQTNLIELSKRAIEKIDFEDIERFYFATESEGDASKPLIALKLLKEIGISKVTPICLKFACLAGIQALISACEYTFATEKPSLILAVDRSIYRDNQPSAEVTQGSAAVAIKISVNPELLAIDYKNIGYFSFDVDDFKVPFSQYPFPEVQGKLSYLSYLHCLKKAFENWEEKNQKLLKKIERKRDVVDFLDFIAFHTPFLHITELVAALFFRKIKEKGKTQERITLEDCFERIELLEEYKKGLKEIRQRKDFQEFFREKVLSIHNYHPRIGNSYTANIFLAILSALEKGKKENQIGIGGYGSGAGAIILRGEIENSGFKSDLPFQLERGKKLSFPEYQKWREQEILKL